MECKECKFWEYTHDDHIVRHGGECSKEPTQWGVCHRYPSCISGKHEDTHVEYWCGEFQEKEKK